MDAFQLIAAMGGINVSRLIDQTRPLYSQTSFSTTLTLAAITSKLNAIFQTSFGIGPAQLNASKDGKIYKPKIPVRSTYVTARIEVSRISGDTWLIDIRRLQGQSFDFVRVFRTIKEAFQ
jgi:hypothetical protein